MHVVIAAIGRMKQGPERSIIESYLDRLPWSVDIREFSQNHASGSRKAAEQDAEKLIGAIPKGAKTICLDSRAQPLTSEAFASQIRLWQDGGVPGLVFFIGGPDGLAQKILDRVDLKLSFGSVTWPHMMVRAMLVEQLYRAHCIMVGHPYHRGH